MAQRVHTKTGLLITAILVIVVGVGYSDTASANVNKELKKISEK